MTNSESEGIIGYGTNRYAEGMKEQDGIKVWYKDGRIHRDGAPAIIYPNGDKVWFKDNRMHRDDGPAGEYISGNKVWCVNGQFHRINGPAVEYPTIKEWYLHGKQYTKKEYKNKMNQMGGLKDLFAL